MNADNLSKSAREKAQRLSDDGYTVFAEPTNKGHRVFRIENNLLPLAKAQGALKNAECVEFPVDLSVSG